MAKTPPARSAAELVGRLSGESRPVPTSALRRVGRTAASLFRGRDLVMGGGDGEVDLARLEGLVRSLGELKGLAMKMGQILSYVDDALPEETRSLLGVLQTWSPPTPFADVEATIRAELGDRADGLLAGLDRAPVASASIGQVHRGVLPGGAAVAVKVQHPGIEDALRADFRAAAPGMALARLIAPGVDARSVVEEARAGFLAECDYTLEAARQQRFGALYGGDPRLAIPAVHAAYSSRRVLTTAWHEGVGLEAWLATSPPAADRQRVGATLYDFYVGTLYRHGLFNADPHPGNLLFEPDGGLVILDHGCVRELDRDTVAAIAALSRAVRADDAGAVRAALVALGGRDPGPGRPYEVTRSLLRAFYGPTLAPGDRPVPSTVARTARDVMRAKLDAMRLHLPGKLMFLLRIRFGLYAVLGRLGVPIDLHALEAELTGP